MSEVQCVCKYDLSYCSLKKNNWHLACKDKQGLLFERWLTVNRIFMIWRVKLQLWRIKTAKLCFYWKPACVRISGCLSCFSLLWCGKALILQAYGWLGDLFCVVPYEIFNQNTEITCFLMKMCVVFDCGSFC